MSTSRRFCRFSRSAEGNPFGLRTDAEDGFCLSAFVLLTRPEAPSSVLVGHANPDGPWDHAGGLDPDRVRAHANGWLLPASQLLLGESPAEAAQRILAEMLGGIDAELGPPKIVSEVYQPRRHPGHPKHWDLEFLYHGVWSGDVPRVPELWRELRFVDTAHARCGEFARSHDEVLDSAGLTLPDAP